MWSEQSTGLALAVSSSVFIGSSFIIKKRGLKAAGATGIRAGEARTKCTPFDQDGPAQAL
jgi:hypothetical protein